MGCTLETVITKFYKADPISRGELKTTIAETYKNKGFAQEDIEQITKMVEERFNARFKKESQQYLKNLLKSKEGVKDVTLEKIYKLIDSGAYDDNAVKDILKQKYGMPVLNADESKYIMDMTNKITSLDKNSNEYRIGLGKIQKVIADKQYVTFRDKFKGVQRVSWLLNPKTLITRNPGGNIILSGVENAKDIPGAFIDMAVSKIRGSERTTLLNPFEKLKWQSEGAKKGLKEWLTDVRENIDTSPSRGGVELPQGRVFDNEFMNTLDQTTRHLLQLGDRPFYEAAYNSRIKELIKIRKITTATEKEIVESKLYALDRVFQNNSELAQRFAKLRDAGGIVGDIIFPFTQTPANIMDKLLDYTPVGFGKAMAQIYKSSKKGVAFDQKLFVDRISRSLTGGGIMALGYAGYNNGWLTGGPEKAADANRFNQEVGNQPYSVKIGDSTFTYDWAQPVSGLIAMGADIARSGKSKEDFISQVLGGGETAVNTMLKQSMLQGTLRMLSNSSPAVGLVKGVTDNLLGIAKPTLLRQVANTIDTTKRETYDPNYLKKKANEIIAGIPFASKALPAKLDTSGKPIQKESNETVGGIAKNVFLNLLSPGNYAEFKPTSTQKEVLRVFNATKLNVFPNLAPKSITYKGENYPLNTDQMSKYQELMGEYVNKIMDTVVNSSGYKNNNVTDEQRAKALQKAITDSSNFARDNIIKEIGADKTKKTITTPIEVPDLNKKSTSPRTTARTITRSSTRGGRK
jgi:hypothetical protein